LQKISKTCEEFQEDLFKVDYRKQHGRKNSINIMISDTSKTLWTPPGNICSVYECC